MYLPLTNYNRRLVEKDRGKNMKVGSVSSGAAAMQRPSAASEGQQVGTEGNQDQRQLISNQDGQKQQNSSIDSKYQSDFYAPKRMSTQDSLGLDDAAGNMMEAVKDIAALQVLEKMLEAINKIMED